ncbi:chloride channel protein 2-like isoform X2 [Babylonia areolata]|uniref:chloride channel protein 2-like isoform X2 n=1 Tax=Babylonia areolata TaxID=304850 RepID=UPI003FD3FB1E
MASGQKFGYEQTLLYGQYRRELGSFAKYQAKRLKKDKVEPPKLTKRNAKLWMFLDRLGLYRDKVFHKVGEDWIFLTILGILMAFLSFAMDYVIEKCQEAKYWLYEELRFSVVLQYFAWVSYSVLFILFAVGFSHIVSPQAVGSGIPEMKTILRGVVLKEFLTFRTLVSKVVGLCSSLGSTLPFGKEGPFVHVASIVATLLSKFFTSFRGIYENESRRSEMLAAACAVGVAGTFAAPIGGVLFSIEVTATFFAVRNYWRGFYSAVCGALVFRLLDFWFKDEETITAVFKTNLRTEFPFDALELLAFAAIGVAMGFGGALFIIAHRKVIQFTRRHKKLSQFLQKNRFIYPGIIALVISSLTFPPGLGQFFAGMLTNKKAINDLFSNITWTVGQVESMNDEVILSHWKHPLTNIYVTLVLFIIMNFIMAVFSNTLPLPAGVFVPVFTIGAAFGRLVGESMATWFPEGIPSGEVMRKIVPGGYAVVGAASLSGSVTRTISTSVIVFELTGQISHVLPAVIAVLIANAIGNLLQPSFYDSIIQIKRLPYLPDIKSSRSNTWQIFVEDFMIRDVRFVPFTTTYGDLNNLLLNTYHRTYPLVDSANSMILLGSIQRFELERMLLVHLSHDAEVLMQDGHPFTTPVAADSAAPTPNQLSPPVTSAASQPGGPPSAPTPLPRFVVTKVDEEGGGGKGDTPKEPSQASVPSSPFLQVPSRTPVPPDSSLGPDTNYNTVHAMPRSILKKSPSSAKLLRSASTGDLKGDVNQFYRKLARERRESRIEDRPFKITSARGSSTSLGKKVKLPPEAVRVHQLTEQQQEEWENAQLAMPVDWEGVQIDPAPFQLVERTSLHKVHSLFSLLGLNHAYVTNTGRLVGVVALKELRTAVQGQIDNQEADKSRRKSSKNESEDDDNEAPIDIGRLEVEAQTSTNTEYRLTHVSEVHRRFTESAA